jgi:hypothetical protein
MTSGDDRSSAAGGRPQHLMLPFHHPKCPHETFLCKFITQNVQLTDFGHALNNTSRRYAPSK